MAKKLSISGQHYLFDVQTFAQVVLSEGGDEFHYSLFDRSTEGVIVDVVDGTSDLGVLVETSENAERLNTILESEGLEFHELILSSPRIALPASHPLANASKLSIEDMADYPYIYFFQGEDAPSTFCEEALGSIPRAKSIACTDRASLSELITALNGYTVTSGILVGISDGKGLVTIPLETDETLHLGYIVKKDQQLNELAQRFVDRLAKNLERYAAFNDQ